MRTSGNFIWFIFGGWWTAVCWLLGALIFAITIVGLPLTRSAVEMAKLTAWPFGNTAVHVRDLDQKRGAFTAVGGVLGTLVNIVWACTFGIFLFISHVFAGVIACCTIIGIPFGIQSFKIALLAFWPVGRRVVPQEVADRIFREKAGYTR